MSNFKPLKVKKEKEKPTCPRCGGEICPNCIECVKCAYLLIPKTTKANPTRRKGKVEKKFMFYIMLRRLEDEIVFVDRRIGLTMKQEQALVKYLRKLDDTKENNG